MNSANAHVTVACVVERDGRYLLVEEQVDGRLVLNQPAGHLDPGESLVEAARRETLEETRWQVDIVAVLGVCLYTAPSDHELYHRTCFIADPVSEDPSLNLDPDIEQVLWLSWEEMQARASDMRSPRVMESVAQYRAGHRYPLAMIYGLKGHLPGQ